MAKHPTFDPYDPEFQRGVAYRAHIAWLQRKLSERFQRIYANAFKPKPLPAPENAVSEAVAEIKAAQPNYGQHGV